MDRRSFVKSFATGSLVTAAAASSLPAPAIAEGKMKLKMVTTWPKNFPGLGTGARRIAKRISEMSDGRIDVKLYAAGELVGAFESFDAVSSGKADCYHGASYYWQGKSKAFNFFCAVPFGLTANELNGWIHHAGGQKLWDELCEGFNLKPFMAGNTGVQMGGWFRKEVNKPEDLKGLKFRMPGLGGEVMRRMGAAVVALPGGEIFPALQSGAIDATEWVGPWNDLAFGFYRVAKFYYYPGFHEPGSGLECTWNLDLWNKLSKADQALIRTACTAENDIMLSEFNANNAKSLKILEDKHKVQLRRFSDELYEEFGKKSEEVLSELAETDDMTKKVHASFIDYRAQAMKWTSLSEQPYSQMRDKILNK